MLFVDYLARVIGHAKTAFSIEEFSQRVFDENFVPNSRYASLLVEEIPQRSRLQAALEVYRRKSEANANSLQYFFNALLPTLSADDAVEFFEAVSAELRSNSDDGDLYCLLQLLNPDYWPKLDEVARLRTENRIISNIQDGRYVRSSNRCVAGGLASWSVGFWKHFVLKSEVMSTIAQKLRSSSDESRDYVMRYCFVALESLGDQPSYILQAALAERLNAGDTRVKNALDFASLWNDQKWNDNLKKAVASFQEAKNSAPLDDDIPF